MPYSEVWFFFFSDGFKEWFSIKGNIYSWGHLTMSRDILFIKIVGMVVLLTSRKKKAAAKYLIKTYYTLHGPEKVPTDTFSLWNMIRDALDPAHESG